MTGDFPFYLKTGNELLALKYLRFLLLKQTEDQESQKKKSEIKEHFQTSVRFDFPHLVSTLSQLFYQTEFCRNVISARACTFAFKSSKISIGFSF